jgi:2-keto-4-pentenoate hydratase
MRDRLFERETVWKWHGSKACASPGRRVVCLGFGDASKIIIIAAALTFFPVFANTALGVNRSTPAIMTSWSFESRVSHATIGAEASPERPPGGACAPASADEDAFGEFGRDATMPNLHCYEAAARLLARQRLSLTLIDPAQDLRPRDENDAYALQAQVNRQLTESGLGSPVGHKIGCTTPVMQAFLDIPSPCAGDVFAATVVRNNARLRRADYIRLGAECEIVVALSQDVAPEDAPFTREKVASAVGAVIAGIEIVDDRYREYRSLGAPTLIADNFFTAGCVLGDPVEDWRKLDLAALAGRMQINGEEVGRGNGAMVLGHPLEALAWLANSRAARGLGLQRGKFVFLGSLVETKWLNAGDSVRIEIEALGALDIAVLP